jgi:hypothetical protein
MALLNRWRSLEDGASLVLVRRAVGLILAWEVGRFFFNGWIEGLYGEGQFRFSYLFLDWVRPWPGVGMKVHFGLMGALALGMFLNWKPRLCSGLLGLGWAYVFLLDQANYLNHLYLVILLLCLIAVVPVREGRVPGWGLDLMRFELGVVYGFAGLAKINSDWLAGEPLTQWLELRSEMPLIGAWLTSPEVGLGLSWVGLVFDILVVPALLWSRTRSATFVLVAVFHLCNALLFHIGIFPWLMLCATTLFFAPDWPRRWLRKPPLELTQDRVAWGMGLRGFLVVWVLVQIALPLRHLAYPGDVAWTEEGHRFSWRMKLRSKKGRVFFHVLNRSTGAQQKVDPCTLLPLRHCRKMSTRPDMILQYAHHLRDQHTAQTGAPIAVHADAIGRLNQRLPQRLVDPMVDLATVDRGLRPSGWIVPLQARTD